MPYLLDANVFINGSRMYYGMDFCPAFWDWLDLANKEGKVFSIEKVADELAQGGDILSEWAQERGEKLFLPPDQKLFESFSVVSEWVEEQDYAPAAISNFFEYADYYLIAYAHAHNFTVVTHEVPSDGYKKVKIPNVCIGLDIKFINTFGMLRAEKASFVLS